VTLIFGNIAAAWTYRNAEQMFALTSWVQVMIGQRIVPMEYHPAVDLLLRKDIDGLVESVRTVISSCVGPCRASRSSSSGTARQHRQPEQRTHIVAIDS
jgi:hypothetical protein